MSCNPAMGIPKMVAKKTRGSSCARETVVQLGAEQWRIIKKILKPTDYKFDKKTCIESVLKSQECVVRVH